MNLIFIKHFGSYEHYISCLPVLLIYWNLAPDSTTRRCNSLVRLVWTARTQTLPEFETRSSFSQVLRFHLPSSSPNLLWHWEKHKPAATEVFLSASLLNLILWPQAQSEKEFFDYWAILFSNSAFLRDNLTMELNPWPSHQNYMINANLSIPGRQILKPRQISWIKISADGFENLVFSLRVKWLNPNAC